MLVEKRQESRRRDLDRRSGEQRVLSDRRERIVAVSVERRNGPRRMIERRAEVRRRLGDRRSQS